MRPDVAAPNWNGTQALGVDDARSLSHASSMWLVPGGFFNNAMLGLLLLYYWIILLPSAPVIIITID